MSDTHIEIDLEEWGKELLELVFAMRNCHLDDEDCIRICERGNGIAEKGDVLVKGEHFKEMMAFFVFACDLVDGFRDGREAFERKMKE